MFENWFEDFSRQYFEEEYNRHYMYNHNKELRPYKNIKGVNIEEDVLRGVIVHDKYEHNRISIRFRQFSEDEKEKLKGIVEDNPINQFKIINKTLPEDLLNAGVKILPESLDDLDIECSFDDERVNLIDVLSLLKEFNRRILKNNFLIFKIRGLNLSGKVTYPVKTMDDILEFRYKSYGEDTGLVDLHDAGIMLLKNIEYPNLSYDFIYDDLFEFLIKEIDSITGQCNSNTLEYEDDIVENFCIDIDNDYNLSGRSTFKSPEKVLDFLNSITGEESEESSILSFLCDVLDLTYTLIRKHSLMPEIFRAEKNYRIRWIPSFYNSNVINYCRNYYPKCPENLVTFNGKPLSRENQVIILVSLIINALFRRTVEKNQIGEFNYISNTVFQLFTGEKNQKQRGKIQPTIENISRQLSVFRMNELKYTYVMIVDDNLDVEIKIREEDTLKSIAEASFDQLKNMKKIYDLFTYNKIENTIYEKITLNNRDFIIFSNNIINLLSYVNVELVNPFRIIHSKMDLVLDIDVDEGDFKLNKISKYYSWKIRLDDTEMLLSDFDEITDDSNEMIKVNDKIYIVDGYTFRHLKSYTWLLQNVTKSNEILQYAILEEFRGIKFSLSDKFRKIINASKIYEAPLSLKGTLRPYQKIGYSWLIQNIKSGFGSILADDMGLGKTLQVLAAILHFKENNQLDSTPSLIIVPPTLISNWQQEIEKFTPNLTYYIYHGTNRRFPSDYYDIVLTSYALIRSDLDMFINESWFICVIDEAQNIKNPSTQQTRAIKELYAFNKIALTGTPIENRLTDYWSIFDFVNEGYLSTQEEFKARYVTPIEKLENEDILNILRKVAKPFVLRRLKSDDEIRKELPEKFVNDVYSTLTKKQIKLYNNLLNGNFEKITQKEGIERKAGILKLITALKQTCNHPAQYLHSEKKKINESGKMELLVNLLENMLDVDEKVLIFTQYVKMGEIIQDLISKKFRIDVLFLHGSQSRKEKEKVINTFQENPEYKILVATLKTGGTGLNLTAAQNVIHYDLWWNPAVENQATDRVHRIGQENDVMVYRFITKGTLEEGIDEILKSKTDLAEKTISTDKTFITELSNEKLKELLRLRL